jgi:MscS family membrane protein
MIDLSQIAIGKRELVWGYQMGVIISLSLLINFGITKFFTNLELRFSKQEKFANYLIIRSLKKPLKTLIWVLGLSLAAESTESYLKTDFYFAIPIFKNLGAAFCISWFLWKLASQYENYAVHNQLKKVDVTTVFALTKLFKLIILIISALLILQAVGINLQSILALVAAGGFGIGFAAKDLLANFFGSIVVYVDKPFSIGNYISSPDREIEGVVEHIGWRLTHVRTPDKRILYVPNSVFSTIIIANPSRMSHRRIYETIGVRYRDINKIDEITKEIKEALTKNKEIDQSQPILVNVDKLEKSSVDFMICAFTATTDWQKYQSIKQDILLNVNEIITKNGGRIALPISVINVETPIPLA